MWEIIRKNKIHSIFAFCAMAIWYALIYGILFAIILINLMGDFIDYNNNNTLYIILASGIIIALLVFFCRFISVKNKPYKFGICPIYQVDKYKNKQLYNVVEEIAIASGIGVTPKIYILYSNVLNAYACGTSPKNSSIVISKALLEVLSREELQGVIAHEMGHIVNRDTMYLLCSGVLYTISATFTMFFMKASNSRGKSAGLYLILFLISLLGQAICFVLFMFISRKREYLADACACVYTRYPKGLADALLKIEKGMSVSQSDSVDNLVKASCIAPLKGKDSFMSTHPSTQNRIKVLMNMASADYAAYEKEFQKLNNERLIPKTALANSKTIDIKKVDAIQPQPAIVAACALNSAIKDESEAQIIRQNKEVLNQNIKKHREVEDFVRNLANYTIINCECNTKLKIPPAYKNQIIICPHCKKKHVITN